MRRTFENAQRFTLRCTCGFEVTYATRAAVTNWRRWHRRQVTPKGSRPSDECVTRDHTFTVTKEV